ncbi:hypothetical protein FEDK69T_22690 [Flavobacterium enshiense DK69]|nr:hypothetical protein FEDK69T_22690 [Flavobacterium enshiense DK69]
MKEDQVEIYLEGCFFGVLIITKIIEEWKKAEVIHCCATQEKIRGQHFQWKKDGNSVWKVCCQIV